MGRRRATPARRAKTVESVLGPLTLARAYYHCAACEAGFCPRDHVLGLQGGSLSPGVLRMVGQVGAMVSFEEGHELLVELAGVGRAHDARRTGPPRRWGARWPRMSGAWSSRPRPTSR